MGRDPGLGRIDRARTRGRSSRLASGRQNPPMSYPEPTYFGEAGEISATFRPATAPPDLIYPNGTAVDYLATGATTRGTFGLYVWRAAPASGGPGPHFHRTINESFFVLAGTIKIYDGRRWIDAEPGDFVHIPEGGLHG